MENVDLTPFFPPNAVDNRSATDQLKTAEKWQFPRTHSMPSRKTIGFFLSLRKLVATLLAVASVLGPNNAYCQDKTAAAIKILERMDTNRDGKLDPSEIPDRSRAAVDRIAAEAGINGKSSISISKLRKRLEKEQKSAESAAKKKDEGGQDRDRAERTSRDKSTSGKSSGFGSSASSSKKKTSTSGFGAAAGSAKDPKVISYVDSLFKNSDKNRNNYIDGKEIETVRARNAKDWDSNNDGKISRSEVTAYISKGGNARSSSSADSKKSSRFGTRSTSTESESARSRSTSSSSHERYKRYASGLVKRYDANKNGYLEKSEWSRVRDAEEADKNRDGVLTVDELATQLRGLSSKSSTSSSTKSKRETASKDSKQSSRDERKRDDRRRSRSDRKTRSRDEDEPSRSERKSYRALTAHERLPSGLPDWFTDKDDNENGQIEMAEYTSSWSDRKVKEFAEFDINDDGVITASECLNNES